MLHCHIKNNKNICVSSTVMFYIFFACTVILSSSIVVHAEEVIAAENSQSSEDNWENTNENNVCYENKELEVPASSVISESDEASKLNISDGMSDTEASENQKADEEEKGTENSGATSTKDIVDNQNATQALNENLELDDSQTTQQDTQTDSDKSKATVEENTNTQKNYNEIAELTDTPAEDDPNNKESTSELVPDDTSDVTKSDSEDQISNESNVNGEAQKDFNDKNTVETNTEEYNLHAENVSGTEEAEDASTLSQQPVQESENNSETTADYVTPQDFGAKGDNENDDTDAINQAIGSLSTEHDTLYIPDGSYRVNTIQKINLRSDIKVILGSNAKLIAISNGEKSYCILSLRGLNNVSITGGQLFGDRYEHQGSEGEWGHGIGVFDSSNIILDGIKIFNCWGDGIYLGSDHEWTQDAGCSNIIIQNCELAGNRRNGLSIVSADYVTLKNCIFRDANGTDPQFGVDIETNYESNPNQHIYLDNCTFYGNAKGSVLINSAANDVQISNSVLNGNFINYAGTDVVLSNTTVNGDAYCRKGIALKDNSVINGRGNTNDVAVVDYSAANAAPLHSYRQDSSNRISSWFASDTNSPSGSYIGIVRTGWGTHDAGITLRLAELSGGRFGKMIPGRTYRIQYTVMGTGAWGYISNQTGWYPILPQGEAYSTGIVTYLAGDTGDGTLSFYATGLNDGMWLRIANIQVLDEDYSGMSQQIDGTWVYSENGNVDTQYTGMASNENGWWYFYNGKLDRNYTGMAANENGWWYFHNGRVDMSYTGEGTCPSGTWYYRNGQIAYGLTGMVRIGEDWRYIRSGKVITDYTGMGLNSEGWWYFHNGKLDRNYTGMAANENGWWYFHNGRVDMNYTGEGTCPSGTWYYRNGRIAYELTGKIWTGTQWRDISNGKIIL